MSPKVGQRVESSPHSTFLSLHSCGCGATRAHGEAVNFSCSQTASLDANNDWPNDSLSSSVDPVAARPLTEQGASAATVGIRQAQGNTPVP